MALTLGYERFVRESTDSNGNTVLVGADGNTHYFGIDAQRPKAMLLGDSQLDRTFLTSATETSTVGYGAVAQAMVELGQAWDWADDADHAVIGDTTALVLARIDAAKAVDAQIVFISLGTNDIWGDLSDSATTIAGIEQVFDAMAGRLIVYIPITPRTYVDATKVGYALAVNNWAWEQQYTRKNFIYVDGAIDAISDPTSTQFAPTTGYMDGSVHWNNHGAHRVGLAIKTKLTGLLMSRPRFPSCAAEAYPTNNASNQLLPSPILAGTTGNKTATGGGTAPTGNVAVGFEVDHAVAGAATCACTVEARTDGIGSDQKLVIASAANSDRWTFRNIGNISAGVSAGEILEAWADVRVSSHAHLSALVVYIQAQVDGGTLRYAYCLRHGTADVAFPATFDGGIYRTRKITLPAGAVITALQYRVEARFTATAGGAGAATILIGRPALWNLSR